MDTLKLYHSPPSDTDINLVGVVRDLLIQEGLFTNIETAFDQDVHIINCHNKKPEVQRHLLNLYLNLQLMKSTIDSSTIRYCLLPDGEIHMWLQYFRSFVLPFLKEHKLIQTPAIRVNHG